MSVIIQKNMWNPLVSWEKAKQELFIKKVEEASKLQLEIAEAKQKAEIEKLKLQAETNEDIKLFEKAKDIRELRNNLVVSENRHKLDLELEQTTKEKEKRLQDLVNEEIVLSAKNKGIDLSVFEKNQNLKYIQDNIDSILEKKNGIIAGNEFVIKTLTSQLAYMQDVLAVAVGKIPEVNLSNFKISGEAPQQKGGDKGGEKKNDQSGKPTNN